jgi:hypothetical protein
MQQQDDRTIPPSATQFLLPSSPLSSSFRVSSAAKSTDVSVPSFHSFELAQKIIAELKQEFAQANVKSADLMSLVANGPEAMTERLEYHEERVAQQAALAHARTVQLNDAFGISPV